MKSSVSPAFQNSVPKGCSILGSFYLCLEHILMLSQQWQTPGNGDVRYSKADTGHQRNWAVRTTRKALQRDRSKIHKCLEKYASTQQNQIESSWQSTFSPKERNLAHSATTDYRMAAAPVTRFFRRVKARICSSPQSQQVCGVVGTELHLARKWPPPVLDLVVMCSQHRSELWA